MEFIKNLLYVAKICVATNLKERNLLLFAWLFGADAESRWDHEVIKLY